MKQIIRGERLLDIGRRAAEPADILSDGETIREPGRYGLARSREHYHLERHARCTT